MCLTHTNPRISRFSVSENVRCERQSNHHYKGVLETSINWIKVSRIKDTFISVGFQKKDRQKKRVNIDRTLLNFVTRIHPSFVTIRLETVTQERVKDLLLLCTTLSLRYV